MPRSWLRVTDRLFRKLTVQEEVLRRVEEAGGRVLAVDAGEVRTDTASRWLTATMLGMVAEYHARLTAEKTRDAKVNAVANGIPPWAILPLGYVRGDDRRVHTEAAAALIAQQAFARREAGASLQNIVMFLRQQGYSRLVSVGREDVLQPLLPRRAHYGKLSNPRSHEAIIDARQFRSVSHMRGDPRGPREDSPNLLARQGLLFCGSCGAVVAVARTCGTVLTRHASDTTTTAVQQLSVPTARGVRTSVLSISTSMWRQSSNVAWQTRAGAGPVTSGLSRPNPNSQQKSGS
jgi:hypothetical protein